MSRVNGDGFKLFQPFDAVIHRRGVVDQRVFSRLAGIGKQITTKQRLPCSTRRVAEGGQEGDGTLGVARNVKDFRLEPEFRQVLPILEVNFRFKLIEFTQPEENSADSEYTSGNIVDLSIDEHISLFDDGRIAAVHGDLRAVLFMEVSAVSGMVEISMRGQDQHKVSRLATQACQLFFEGGPLIRPACIDQEITGLSFDQVAIDAAEAGL